MICFLHLISVYLVFINTDVDECAERFDACPGLGECENTYGSFVCICPVGLTGVNCDDLIRKLYCIIRKLYYTVNNVQCLICNENSIKQSINQSINPYG